MKIAFFALALAFSPSMAAAYPHDAQLSAKLKKEFEAVISSSAAGRELYARLEKAGPGYAALKVLVRRDPADCFAWFDPSANAVYFNSRFILKFFETRGFKDPKVVEVLWSNKEVRAELVRRADPVYLHELVHALQCYLYPEYRRDAGANPLEFEYEAYLTEDMYVHERMKADPGPLKDFILGVYTDIYTANIFGSYLSLSLDPARYRERIRRFYEEQLGGYLSLEKAETIKKNGLADSKIFAYASGNIGGYTDDTASLARLRAQKAEFSRFLEDFYAVRWPAFSADALLFVGTLALEQKNYPLALDCLAVADANSPGYGLSAEALAALRTKGALAVLETASFIRDTGGKMSVEVLSQHLKALEKACAATGRPFPGDLAGLRVETYPKAMAYYAKKYAAETDRPRRDYYKENLDYFSAGSGPAGGGRR
ncbi:MAG: hypothetical protein A2081_01715 [Elusimicrobia bacterium GWC2_61_19]|nr:MAG: hypothetical protein A2081_01715 [Elusimicrobia bacterium GWC2_61_19]